MATKRSAAQETAAEAPGPRSHEDTWGATEGFKQQWQDKNADQVRQQVERQNTEGDAQ